MADNKVKSENFVTIQGFMVKDLKLKGNELLIYAIIYGFSQTEGQVFNGSLQYLADWTNSTKQGVSKSLKLLVEKGCLQKNEKYINGVKFCEYYATKFNRVLNKVDGGMQQSLIGGIKQSLTNNIDIYKIDNNIENNIGNNVPYQEIIEHLNNRTGSSYRHTTKKTRDLIKARFNEGFTLDDFKVVIDKKCIEWINDKEMNKYLRPETLFGTKFEGYLNQQVKAVTTKDLPIDVKGFFN